MMAKRLCVLMIVCVGIVVTACSNETEDNKSTADQADISTEEKATENSRTLTDADDAGSGQDMASTEQQEDNAGGEEAASQADESTQADRKVIYNANLRIEVTDYQETVDSIQAEVSERGGYIVDSNMHEDDEEGSISGRVTARIPQGEFEEFVQIVEDGSSTVMESSVSGQDVTEEYVDLESRLESKRVVEERLLSFMEEADKTEDLLNISDDLATVQQEIEEITGRMTYLENKVDLATVTINIQENNVAIAGEEDLNTWEKTKQQFMQSINFLLSAFSGLFVFIIGNLPVLIILAVIAVILFWVINKRIRGKWRNE
ncbi:DUF4349 domain-containing protein [Lentibacillus sp. CBA3610]|uniref:DUF4349 domain-containing protein n=1 Tax=Lentibacillus sp. CBA3610 TaxID=2518176 RepID=UPI0015952531|nr:DUF4349 domain-containing protein [Lentibacillus sp. CBA3610]QKY68386.1 DUF4349 domain-containing protein [Lentibacillus sp. CBA3610]